MHRFTYPIVFVLLTSCLPSKKNFETDYKSTDNLRLTDAVAYESKIRSVNKTPNHPISIGKGIYPNEKNHELAIPTTFLRTEGYFETQVSYYYTASDSSVRVILYQWDKKDLESYETKKELKNKFKRFKNQWKVISTELNERFGLPAFEQIKSDKYGNRIIEDNQSIQDIMLSIGNSSSGESTAWRDDMKWDTQYGHAYLFMFGDNKTGYRQIRLAIYGE